MSPQTNRVEKAIADHISSERDLPTVPVKLRYAIVAQQRTGSTLLATALAATKQAGVPTEYLNPIYIAAYQDRFKLQNPFTVANYLLHLESIRTTQNGAFGIKCLQFQLANRFPTDKALSKFFKRYDRIIFLYRKDKLAQSVSNMKGMQSDVWQIQTSEDPKTLDVEYQFDLPLISRSLHAFIAQEQRFRKLLSELNVPILTLSYEELTEGFDSVWPTICHHLGVRSVSASDIEFKLRQQRDRKSEELTEEFLCAIRNSDLYFKKP
ncbi:MAG: Stf0 family sulfotransferase [Dongiaceae bacterium]